MSVDLLTLAAREGLALRQRGFGPCPVCGAEKRGHADRRPPVSIFRRDGEELWHCKAASCGAGGGVAALLAALRFHEIPSKGDARWAEVMAELEGPYVHSAPNRPSRARRPVHPSWPPAAAPISPPRAVSGAARSVPTADPETHPYPPVSEVLALWNASQRLDTTPANEVVAGYLAHRGIDPRRCGLLDLSRATAPAAAWPRWIPLVGMEPATWGRTYRLVTPMIDATGTIRSLRFRAVGEVPAGKKALNPTGYGYAGLVMADPLGVALLRGERADEGVSWDGRVVVVEGEPDFWTWSCHAERFGKPSTWAVFGVVSGSWSEALAERIPDHARVILRTHHDDPGHKYAERIRATLAGRCEIFRSSPPGTRDAPQAS